MSALLLATIFLGAADLPAITPAEAAAGKSLLEKAVAAAGGAKEIATIQDVTFSGTVAASFDGIEAGGKVTLIETREGTTRNQMDIGGFEMVSVIGPKGGYTSQAGLSKQLGGNDLVQAQAQSRFTGIGLLMHGFEPGVGLRARPQEGGLDVLEVRPPGADPITFYFDPVTHYVSRIRVVNLLDGTTLVSNYSLYKPVDGVQLPHRMELSQSGLEMTLTFTQIQINAGVPAGLMPSETTRRVGRLEAAPDAPEPAIPQASAARSPVVEPVTIAIVNRTGKILNEVHFSPAGKKDWGANLLPVDRFHDGDTVKLPVARGGGCAFDLMVADTDGQYSVLPGTDLCKSSTLTLRPGKRGGLIFHEK